MADVQIAVGLGRETHLQLIAAAFELAGLQFLVDYLFNKISSFG